MLKSRYWICSFVILAGCACPAFAQRLEVPRRHDRPPGPPLSPEEAVAKMTVPEGFSVEIVAAEPDLVNPVAMCIDEKGRFWITESVEYPRREPGPGRDRVKVLEDTDGDGKVDKVTVFAEGLNIPSGIAVGYGGVWVANSPDILFMQDTDGDLKADKIETVVTGFGRDDTHELPNSLTWGPDGWLYGLNGVFNYSHVRYAESNPNYDPKHPGWEFTCAMFRIHPRTREFQIFAQGTSNPWGIAINDEGDFFISACVIDHLWHIVESAYYIRQGGPYPPHTWPMGSIVDHHHQKAAYCGITWFDSDAYPEKYRGVLYMGNIHGGCINADILERSGSTYKGKPHPGFPPKPGAWDNDEYGTIAKTGDDKNPKLADFLTANDPWFMPVVQKTGPDGCLYILDWYDRYHCYQDANADPEGIERAKGRLYRVRYKDTPHAQPFDLAQESDEQLIGMLNGRNEYVRATAQRLLAERLSEDDTSQGIETLSGIVKDRSKSTSLRRRALWTLKSGGQLTAGTCTSLLVGDDKPDLERWALRFAAEMARSINDVAMMKTFSFAGPNEDPSRLLVRAISIPKMLERVVGLEALQNDHLRLIMGELLSPALSEQADPLVVHVVWQQLVKYIQSSPAEFVRIVVDYEESGIKIEPLHSILNWSMDPVIDGLQRDDDVDQLGVYLEAILNSDIDENAIETCLLSVVRAAESGQLRNESLQTLKSNMGPRFEEMGASIESPHYQTVLSLKARWGDSEAQTALMRIYSDDNVVVPRRIEALQTLIASVPPRDVLSAVSDTINSRRARTELRIGIIESVGAIQDEDVGGMVAGLLVDNLSGFEAEVQPRAIEVLTQRPAWSLPLLKAIQARQIDKDLLNLNQLKRVALFKNEELQKLVTETFGAIRQDRRSDRQGVINSHRDFLNGTPGDPERGAAAFKKVCGQCHKIYGEGADVGPDITRNGRNNWEQLLQNVFDPSAVIGPGYQARVMVTDDGRVLTGLPVEESAQRVVLKIQGGKLETIPRGQIDEYVLSEMSMMPEDLEKQLTPQEIADLFAFLALDKPPSDPTGTYLPGAPNHGK